MKWILSGRRFDCTHGLKALVMGALLITSIRSEAYQRPYEKQTILLLTIPKSGTTMAQKYFILIKDALEDLGLQVTTQHFNTPFSQQEESALDQMYVMKKVVLIRDLRDVFCSLVDMLDIQIEGEAWEFLQRKEKIKKLLGFSPKIPADLLVNDYAATWTKGMQRSITAAVEVQSIPNTCVVRYEALVGPKGGVATDEEMHREMKKINDFIGISLSDSEYEYIKGHLFGGSSTFNKGRVGRWKSEFDAEVKELFKLKYGQELIKLGYEENLDW